MDPAQILLVDDDVASIQLLAHILGGLGQLRFATRGEQALALAQAHPPDLVLLDAEMPGQSGLATCAALKADPLLADVPVIFVTSHSEQAMELAGLEAGAADFISKPVSPPLVLARARTQLRLKRLTDALKQHAGTDTLTGVANRRSFDTALAAEWARLRRGGAPLSLLMIDVDHFKRYNDHHGHVAGDACLRRVAEALRTCLRRPADLLARYGGEEFAMLLPLTDSEGALRVAEQALAALQGAAIPHDNSPTGAQLTLSIGVASTLAAGAAAPQDLVEAADAALYRAKAAGRARACSAVDAPA